MIPLHLFSSWILETESYRKTGNLLSLSLRVTNTLTLLEAPLPWFNISVDDGHENFKNFKYTLSTDTTRRSNPGYYLYARLLRAQCV